MKKLLMTVCIAGALISCKNNETTEATTDTNESEVAYNESSSDMEEETMQEGNMQEETIAAIAMGNENFSTLVAALKAAGIAETFTTPGPFTVFAPTNDAFGKLPEGTVTTLLEPENKTKLTDILTYHVVAGNYMAADVVKAIKDNNGKFKVNTVNGEQLTLMMDGNNVVIKDAKGGMSTIIMTDVKASNGVIHAINTVVMPAK